MKHPFYLLALGTLLLLAACSSRQKEQEEARLAARADSVAAAGPQCMQVSDVKETFTFRGKEYNSSVVRRPDSTLPLISDEQGAQFVDNRISLRITCENKMVVDRTFTKEDFASLVDARFLKHALLEGLVFDQTTPQGMVYAASVCYPQSDLYIPIRLTITADGYISMAKEELMEEYRADCIQ